jgi:hypothetical protein
MAIEELAKQQIPGVGITNRGTVAESIRPGQLRITLGKRALKLCRCTI